MERALPGALFAAATLIGILAVCVIKLFDSSSLAQPVSVSTWQLLLQVHFQWVLLGLAVVLAGWKMPSFLGLRRS